MVWKNLFGETEVAKPKAAAGPVCVHIRWMIRRDMAEVLQIENESFDCPWQEADFIRCLQNQNTIGIVAEAGDRVAGYAIYEYIRTRIHLLNLAVAPQRRGRGVGSELVAWLITRVKAQQRKRIALEIRESNLRGQVFFRDHGFRATSILHAFYDTGEHAYLMEYRLKTDRNCKGR